MPASSQRRNGRGPIFRWGPVLAVVDVGVVVKGILRGSTWKM